MEENKKMPRHMSDVIRTLPITKHPYTKVHSNQTLAKLTDLTFCLFVRIQTHLWTMISSKHLLVV